MCERHSEQWQDYCQYHECLACRQCRGEEHTGSFCDLVPLSEAIKELQPQLEVETADLQRLQKRAKEIMEGKHRKETEDAISLAEQELETFYSTMRKRIELARRKARPFSETDLSRQLKVKLNTLVTTTRRASTASAPVAGDHDDPLELIAKLKNTKEMVAKAKEILYSLPNYIEMKLNEDFSEVVKFKGDPIEVTTYGDTENGFDEGDSYASEMESIDLKEISTFYIEHCSDVIILKEHVIASVRDSVQKRDKKQLKFRQGLPLVGAGTMCQIGDNEIAVMQRAKCITTIKILPRLSVVYRLSIELPYGDMCFVVSLPSVPYCPNPSPVYAVCYVKRETFLNDYVDLVQAKETRFPGRPPLYGSESSHVVSSAWGRHKHLFRGITCVGTGLNGTIVIGASKGVSCVTENGTLMWVVRTSSVVTHLMAWRSLICVALHDEHRVLTIGKSGQEVEKNILPANGSNPERMGISEDIMLVKESGTWDWFFYRINAQFKRID